MAKETYTIEEMAKTKDVVYVAMYNPMIHESIFGIISIHKTRKGAEMAMEFHKAGEREKYDELTKKRKLAIGNFDYSPFGTFQAWEVFECKINE